MVLAKADCDHTQAFFIRQIDSMTASHGTQMTQLVEHIARVTQANVNDAPPVNVQAPPGLDVIEPVAAVVAVPPRPG